MDKCNNRMKKKMKKNKMKRMRKMINCKKTKKKIQNLKQLPQIIIHKSVKKQKTDKYKTIIIFLQQMKAKEDGKLDG